MYYVLEHFRLFVPLKVSVHLSSLHVCVFALLCMRESSYLCLHTHICVCEGRITGKGLGKQIHFLWVENATGSWFLSGGAAVTQHCLSPRLTPTSSRCYPPPVKLIVHLLGSHSSLCSPERDNWIPHLWPQPHWWMALMGFYCLMYPLSSSFYSKSNLLSLYLFTLDMTHLFTCFSLLSRDNNPETSYRLKQCWEKMTIIELQIKSLMSIIL